MSPAARSLFWFGLYLLVSGAAFLVVPDIVLTAFGAQPPREPWIRVAGMFAMYFGYYYCRAARAELRVFFIWTVQVRVAAAVVFAMLVWLALAPAQLLAFGAVDVLGAAWTAWCLRTSV